MSGIFIASFWRTIHLVVVLAGTYVIVDMVFDRVERIQTCSQQNIK